MYAPRVISQLAGEPSSNKKLEILKVNKDNQELTELLELALNPMKTFKITNIDFTPSTLGVVKNQHKEFVELANLLASSNINDRLRKKTLDFINSCDVFSQEVYTNIITKNLRSGIGATQVNKVHENLIPVFKCMLADTDDQNSFNFPSLVQEKMDGVRCLVFKHKDGSTTAFSRHGQPMALPHIFKALPDKCGKVFDGELVAGSRPATSGICNKVIKETAKPEEVETLEFHIFDMLDIEEFLTLGKKATSGNCSERLLNLSKMFTQLSEPCLKLVPTFKVFSLEEIKTLYAKFRGQGSEGIIVKHPFTPYEFKRSKNWSKLKAINSCTLKITGATEGTGKYQGMLGSLDAESSDGLLKVTIGSGLTDALREELWTTFKNGTLINRLVEVVYNELSFVEGQFTSLFLPRFHDFREDKDAADTLEHIKKEQV